MQLPDVQYRGRHLVDGWRRRKTRQRLQWDATPPRTTGGWFVKTVTSGLFSPDGQPTARSTAVSSDNFVENLVSLERQRIYHSMMSLSEQCVEATPQTDVYWIFDSMRKPIEQKPTIEFTATSIIKASVRNPFRRFQRHASQPQNNWIIQVVCIHCDFAFS